MCNLKYSKENRTSLNNTFLNVERKTNVLEIRQYIFNLARYRRKFIPFIWDHLFNILLISLF